MFFYEKIRNNPLNNNVAIFIINFLIKLRRIFIPHKKRFDTEVVIIALHRLGDAVFTIPAIKSIIDFHKKAVRIICYPEITPIYKLAFKEQDFIEIRHEFFFINNQVAKPVARRLLRRLNPSTIYDMTGNVTSASLLFNSSANEIIGINEKYYRSIYTKFRELRSEPHLTENYLDGISYLIPVSKDVEIKINSKSSESLILIHPFASKKSKEWGLKNFIRLAESLNKKFNCKLVTPPHSIASDIKAVMEESKISLIETQTTEELVDLINSSSILIGNDSGAVHIANLLGKPTFTIYGPTNPEYHKPLSGINEYIIKDLSCSAKGNEKICFTFGGVYCPSNECMVNLSYLEVEKKINSFLDKNLSKKFH